MQCPRVLLSAAAVAAMSAVLWHSQAGADALDHYQPAPLVKAERALERGDAQRALGLLEGRVDTLRGGVERARGHALVCRARFSQGEYELAERACDAAVEEGGAAAAWRHLNNRGVMRLMLGRSEEALADFRAAERLNPAAGSVRRNLAAAKKHPA